MALTPSRMGELGQEAPPFRLPEVTTGALVSRDDFADQPALLVMFLCRHCPYVVHVQHELARLARDYQPRGLAVVAISANDAGAYPDDAPARLAEQAREVGFVFPYLHDATQEVARAYGAACTPDFFLFDDERRLVYRGRLDESRPGSPSPVTGRELRQAIDAALTGQPPLSEQRPSLGCNVKWRAA